MKRKWPVTVAILALGLVSLILLASFTEVIPLPVGLRHLINLVLAPGDLYRPIVSERFAFHERGFSATYPLRPKHLDIYEIGFSSEKADIPSSYRFGGRLRAEFLHGDEVILEQVITSATSAVYAKGDLQRYASVALLQFAIPLQGRYRDDLELRLTVLEADPQLESLRESIRLYVAVSGVP